jgi:two-component system, LuxR family, response regulator FixJ
MRAMKAIQSTVYVIDDDPGVLASSVTLASSLELTCKAFASAEEFLDRFDYSRPGCLVAGMRLAGMSGLELQERLAAAGIPLPVILLSDDGDVSATVRAMRNGAFTVLQRPYRTDDLTLAIRAAIEVDRGQRADRQKRSQLKYRLDTLGPRQRQVLEMVTAGQPNKVIARRLGVSPRTVDRARAQAFATLGVQTAVEAARLIVTLGNQR